MLFTECKGFTVKILSLYPKTTNCCWIIWETSWSIITKGCFCGIKSMMFGILGDSSGRPEIIIIEPLCRISFHFHFKLSNKFIHQQILIFFFIVKQEMLWFTCEENDNVNVSFIAKTKLTGTSNREPSKTDRGNSASFPKSPFHLRLLLRNDRHACTNSFYSTHYWFHKYVKYRSFTTMILIRSCQQFYQVLFNLFVLAINKTWRCWF